MASSRRSSDPPATRRSSRSAHAPGLGRTIVSIRFTLGRTRVRSSLLDDRPVPPHRGAAKMKGGRPRMHHVRNKLEKIRKHGSTFWKAVREFLIRNFEVG